MQDSLHYMWNEVCQTDYMFAYNHLIGILKCHCKFMPLTHLSCEMPGNLDFLKGEVKRASVNPKKQKFIERFRLD